MGYSLWLFFAEGGWGMWPTLLFGVCAVGGAIWFAIRPEPRRLMFTAAMWLTLVTAAVHATWTNVAFLWGVLEDPQRIPDAQIVRVLFQGLKEGSRPGALAGIFLTLVPLILGVGALRTRSTDG
jgi:hypothetical protein